MRNKYLSGLLFLLFTILSGVSNAQNITEKYLHNQTPTYKETVSFFKGIALKDKRTQLKEIGLSDGGLPIHLFVISGIMDFNPGLPHE
jgi:hypothetical protein